MWQRKSFKQLGKGIVSRRQLVGDMGQLRNSPLALFSPDGTKTGEIDMLEQLRETVILLIESFHDALRDLPFQQADTTLELSLHIVTSQSCIPTSQSHTTASSTAMHSAQPMLRSSDFQPGRSCQAAHEFPDHRPIPHEVKASIQMSLSTDLRGVRLCNMSGCESTSCHQVSWERIVLGRWCLAKSLGK